MARPIPLDPPVTMAVRPSNSDIQPDLLPSDRQRFDSLLVHLKPDADPRRDLYRTAGADRDRRIYYVFLPVALRCRNVARKRKPGKSGHRNVMSAANACLQHAAAPTRH